LGLSQVIVPEIIPFAALHHAAGHKTQPHPLFFHTYGVLSVGFSHRTLRTTK
jgi:hypothetical protein